MTTSYGPPRPRTPRVGERYVVPDWIRDRQGWHDAMDEVEKALQVGRFFSQLADKYLELREEGQP